FVERDGRQGDEAELEYPGARQVLLANPRQLPADEDPNQPQCHAEGFHDNRQVGQLQRQQDHGCPSLFALRTTTAVTLNSGSNEMGSRWRATTRLMRNCAS